MVENKNRAKVPRFLCSKFHIKSMNKIDKFHEPFCASSEPCWGSRSRSASRHLYRAHPHLPPTKTLPLSCSLLCFWRRPYSPIPPLHLLWRPPRRHSTTLLNRIHHRPCLRRRWCRRPPLASSSTPSPSPLYPSAASAPAGR